jgi:hypothetical protein
MMATKKHKKSREINQFWLLNREYMLRRNFCGFSCLFVAITGAAVDSS